MAEFVWSDNNKEIGLYSLSVKDLPSHKIQLVDCQAPYRTQKRAELRKRSPYPGFLCTEDRIRFWWEYTDGHREEYPTDTALTLEDVQHLAEKWLFNHLTEELERAKKKASELEVAVRDLSIQIRT